jgi:NAD(P)-dependent dehydrogenase (short-subunit alcohol dehydrogenase family)
MTSLVYGPSDRWAVVTGAARGLGKAISERLAAVGFLVAGIDHSDTIHASAKSLPGEGHVGVVGDAAAPEALAEAFAVIPADARLSVFVANAGVTDPGDSLTYPLESWDRLHAILLRASFLGAREAAARMPSGGSIIMISSINGTLGFAGRAAYGAAKAGVQGLVRSLAVEWAPRGIRVNAIAPGAIATEMQREFIKTGFASEQRFLRHIPAARLGQPSDIAHAVSFLASDESQYITGVTLPVDGGWAALGMGADD